MPAKVRRVGWLDRSIESSGLNRSDVSNVIGNHAYTTLPRTRLRKVVIGHDCGMMVNPAGVRTALEGQIMQGISRALNEGVRFDESRVTSVDWRTYPIATLDDMPGHVDLVLLNRPTCRLEVRVSPPSSVSPQRSQTPWRTQPVSESGPIH